MKLGFGHVIGAVLLLFGTLIVYAMFSAVKNSTTQTSFIEEHCTETLHYSFDKHNQLRRIVLCDEVYDRKKIQAKVEYAEGNN